MRLIEAGGTTGIFLGDLNAAWTFSTRTIGPVDTGVVALPKLTGSAG
jgi:hypothetical protein